MALIVLDAGHGGENPGATYQGRQEKDDALNIALAVGAILERQGQEVYYTRTTDIYESPQQKRGIRRERTILFPSTGIPVLIPISIPEWKVWFIINTGPRREWQRISIRSWKRWDLPIREFQSVPIWQCFAERECRQCWWRWGLSTQMRTIGSWMTGLMRWRTPSPRGF